MKNIFFILFILSAMAANAANSSSLTYIRYAVNELLNDSRMDYETTLKMPDGSMQKASGVMAFKGSNFYDSSANRFVLQNDRWFIGADHIDKTIKVMDMVLFKKEYGQYGNMSQVNILFDADSTLFDNMRFSVLKVANNETIIEIVMPEKSHQVKKLKFRFMASSKIPVSYSGELAYPVDYETVRNKITGEEEVVPSQYAELVFSCTNIARTTPGQFDHTRIIKNENGKDVVVRYRNYETIYTKKNKK